MSRQSKTRVLLAGSLTSGNWSASLLGLKEFGRGCEDLEFVGPRPLANLDDALDELEPAALVLELPGPVEGQVDEDAGVKIGRACRKWVTSHPDLVVVACVKGHSSFVVWTNNLGFDTSKGAKQGGDLLNLIRSTVGRDLVSQETIEVPVLLEVAGVGDAEDESLDSEDTETKPAEDFPDTHEHLRTEFEGLDLTVRALVESHDRQRSHSRVSATREQVLSAFGGSFSSSTRLKKPSPKNMAKLNRRLEQYRGEATRSAFARLGHRLGLTREEELILLVCLAPEFDAKYSLAYEFLQGNAGSTVATVGLCVEILKERVPASRVRSLLSTGRTLLRKLVLGTPTDGRKLAWNALPLFVEEGIVGFLQGDTREIAHASPSSTSESLPVSADSAYELHRMLEHSKDPSAKRLLVNVYGPAGSGRRAVIAEACTRAGLNLARLDIRSLPEEDRAWARAVRETIRDTRIRDMALWIDGFDELLESRPKLRMLLEAVADFVLSPLFLVSGASWKTDEMLEGVAYVEVGLGFPEVVDREQLWRHFLPSLPEELRDDVARKFRLTAGQIRDAAAGAVQHAQLRGSSEILVEELLSTCRGQSRHRLETLGSRVAVCAAWENLVLPPDQLSQLDELTDQVRCRERVFSDWQLGKRYRSNRGLTALFCGPSGTGKTMAAEVLAKRIGLDLFKIDLSRVVSKYIGETEKNIREIFDEAEDSNTILMFDEADALFGKRSEVKDSHDRYANIEVSYLLQRMEAYTGIAILATNLKRNMDSAFLRRLRFVIDFPMPDAKMRETIWRGAYPLPERWNSRVDFEFLGKSFEITGGNITNVCLRAAYKAVAQGESSVRMHHVMAAVRRELQKLGRPFDVSELEPYGDWAFSVDETKRGARRGVSA